MRITLLSLLSLFAIAPAHAQDNITAGDALTQDICERMRDAVMPRIELYTRMKFRRGVPVKIEPFDLWDTKRKRGGFAGNSAKHALAYYRPGINDVTVVPWVIGGYARDKPAERTKQEWIEELEPTMIHELTHAIHHQNFYSEGRIYAASLKADGLTEEELDRSTVDFLMGEGVPELVALRTTDFVHRMGRHPSGLVSPTRYMLKYKPDGKEAYRIKLLANGYVDGLNLMHHIALKSGPRGIRGILYRPPPRVLLFQPDVLATVELDDPPEPDAIFQILSPSILQGREILRATFPGAGRFFRTATVNRRTRGCLIGYCAEVDENPPDGAGRYAFFVADPDEVDPAWIPAQVASIKEMNPSASTEKQVDLAIDARDKDAANLKVRLVTVPGEGGLYVYAEADGLVVVAHETKPTKNLEQRVTLALRALHIRRPKADLYKDATAKALAKLNG